MSDATGLEEYEIEVGDILVSLTVDRAHSSVSARSSASGGLGLKVRTRSGYTRGGNTSGAGLTISMPGLSELVQSSDLPEAEKRQAIQLLEALRSRKPKLSDIATLLLIFDRSEPLRTQVLHWIQQQPFFK